MKPLPTGRFSYEPHGSYFKLCPRIQRETAELIVFWLWWRIVLPIGCSGETAYCYGFVQSAGHRPRSWPYPLDRGKWSLAKSGTWRTFPVTFRGPNVRCFLWFDWSLEMPLPWSPEAALQAGYDDGFMGDIASHVHHDSMGSIAARQAA